MKHYCLVSFSRTGSTALEKALNSHKCISHDFTRLPQVEDRVKWVNDFLNRNDTLLEWMGFKCLLYQFDDWIVDYILQNEKFTKIILLRHNIFEAAISKKVAERINNWHIKVDYNNVEPFSIDISWLTNYIKIIRFTMDEWVNKSINYKIFYYEDLFFNEEYYKPVIEYLSVGEIPIKYEISKVNDYDSIKNIIINYEELENVYEKIK